MDNLDNVRLAITSLKEPSSKLKNYTTIKNYLESLTKTSLVNENWQHLQIIIDSVSVDLTNQTTKLKGVLLHVLSLILKCFVKDIPSEETDRWNYLNICLKLLIRNDCDLQPIFFKLSDKSLKDKVCNLLFKVFSELPAEKTVVFFYAKNVSAMFEYSNANVRDGLIKLNNQLLPKFNITLLSSDKFDKYKDKVRQTYVPKIAELRCAKDSNWANLYKFLLLSLGKLLHVQVDVINDLLKAVESAFRSSNLDDRFQAFDCWKELINNYALDLNRLCGPKQMKLLVTPLRTNISTNDHIINKRFEVWCHLFNLLQEKAFACLEPFLQFCFRVNANSSPSMESMFSPNTRLFEDSTQALVEIMGHYQHVDTDTCIITFTEPYLKLNKALVTPKNFIFVADVVIHSVTKCTVALKQWLDPETVPKAVTCLWGSLFSKLKGVPEEKQEQILQNIVSKLLSIAQSTNYQQIVMPILLMLTKETFFDQRIFTRNIFFPLIKALFDEGTSICLTDSNVVSEFIACGKDMNDIDWWLNQAYDIISNSKDNFHNVLLMWIECTGLFLSMNEDFHYSFQENVVDFMVWPVLNIEVTSIKLNKDFLKEWKKAFKYVTKLYPQKSVSIIQKLETATTQENSSLICSFYKAFCQSLEDSQIVGYETALFQLTQHLLSSFCLKKPDVTLLLPAVVVFLNNTVKNGDTSNFTPLCNCCTIILQLYKKSKLLNTLDEVIDKVDVPIPETLKNAIFEMKNAGNETKTAIDDIVLQNDNRPALKTVSPRGRKLVAMIKHMIPKPKTDPSSLVLLGQNVSSPSHKDIRGSQLNNKVNSRHKRISNKLNFNNVKFEDDDEDAKFVSIDTEFKFDPKKLSLHQLEVFKTPKSDIPALYQDLSQSQSNFGSNSNSNSKSIDLNNSKANEEQTVLPQEEPKEELVDLHVRNPTEEKIDAMIRNGVKEIGIDIVKKRGRVEKELMKLKLDIVGNEFVKNIDLLGKRETRRKSDISFKQFKFLKVPDLSTIKQGGTPDATKTRRRCAKKKIPNPVEPEVTDNGKVENNNKEEQSEDVIESSQKTQDNNINNGVISILNSELEEYLAKFSSSYETDVSVTKETDEATCDMETETVDICNEDSTPKKATHIPTSPIQVDTPTRTSELIKDTVDISPIKVVEESQKTQELFESESLDIIPVQKYETVAPLVQESLPDNAIRLTFFNNRFKKFSSSKSSTPINKRVNKIIKSPVVFSAQTHRIMKMMQKCEKKLEFHEQVKEVVEIVSDEDDANQEFFKFVKELPSPKASPRCSILKRKACEFDDGLEPPRKKRVNFPDPPLTSKIMYVPDVNEHNRVVLDPFALFGNVDEIEEDDEEGDKLLSEDTPLDSESQGSVDMVDVQLLNASDPVFPDLIHCDDDVKGIVASLSDSVFAQSLLDELYSKDINTIGALAGLTEVDVNRLPIKSPKLVILNDVLTKYVLAQETGFSIANDMNQVHCETNKPVIVQTKQKRRVPLKPAVESDTSKVDFNPLLLEPVLCNAKMEIKPEDVLNKLLEELDTVKLSVKKEGVKLTALCKILTEIMEPNELLQIFQDNATFSLSSLIKEKDWPKILNEVIVNIGLKQFVALLCSIPTISPISILRILIDESIEMHKDNNSLEFEETISRVVEISSPSVALKHLTLPEIVKETHCKCNDSRLFFSEAFRVFSPRIEDIIPNFQYIQIVKFEDTSLQRGEEEDLLTFVERIMSVVDTSKVCSLIPKEKMLPFFTKDELTDGIVQISNSPCGIIESCEKLMRGLSKADNMCEPLFFNLLDKIPTPVLYKYFSNHLSNLANNVQNIQ